MRLRLSSRSKVGTCRSPGECFRSSCRPLFHRIVRQRSDISMDFLIIDGEVLHFQITGVDDQGQLVLSHRRSDEPEEHTSREMPASCYWRNYTFNLRYSPGVMPILERKTLEKYISFSKPVSKAISLIFLSKLTSMI